MGTNLQGLPEVTSLLDVDIFHTRIIATGKDKKITLENLRNVIGSLPQTVDLTASNVIVTLPEITGVLQTKSIYWIDGGTYRLTLAVTDGATVGGVAASIWEGEGEGHMLLESDGSNWQVREYEDSGSNSEERWSKFKDGKMFQSGLSVATPDQSGSNSIAITLPKSFNNMFYTPHFIAFRPFVTFAGLTITGISAISSVSTFTYAYSSTTSQIIAPSPWSATGRWRT